MNQFFLNNAVGAPNSVADGSRALANVLGFDKNFR